MSNHTIAQAQIATNGIIILPVVISIRIMGKEVTRVGRYIIQESNYLGFLICPIQGHFQKKENTIIANINASANPTPTYFFQPFKSFMYSCATPAQSIRKKQPTRKKRKYQIISYTLEYIRLL